jgi:replication-associated recombination protein RarA
VPLSARHTAARDPSKGGPTCPKTRASASLAAGRASPSWRRWAATCAARSRALQKSIRRSDERGALFWATELELSGFGGYVWKRLRIISSEDVGLAEPLMPLLVRSLYENWLEETKRQKTPGYEGFHRVFLVHAVVALARARKSRMLDHALVVMYAGERPTPEVPDYALDRHTQRGRELGRGFDHFVAEGARLENEAGDVADEYADEARELLARRRPRPQAEEEDDGQLSL